MFFQRFKLNTSSISHQQAVMEHWDLPKTEIFQSKDVASAQILKKYIYILDIVHLNHVQRSAPGGLVGIVSNICDS
jgi:hypothetical protein